MTNFLDHHAYLIESRSLDAIKKPLEKDGIQISGNPDFHVIETESLGVEDSRKISELSILKSFGDRKFILIHFESATHEAQNALLKVLEDPTPNTHFILVTPQAETLLPTLLSRLEKVTTTKDATADVLPLQFLAMPYEDRLELVEKMAKEAEKGKAIGLIDGIEKLLYETKGEELEEDRIRAFREIARARKYIGLRGASLKLILSHFSLSIPIFHL